MSADQMADRGDVVEINLGHDVLVAQRVSAELGAQAVEHELLLSDDPYVGLDHTTPHRLMVFAKDRGVVAQIIDDLWGSEVSTQPRLARGSRFFIAVILVLAFVVPFGIGVAGCMRSDRPVTDEVCYYESARNLDADPGAPPLIPTIVCE